MLCLFRPLQRYLTSKAEGLITSTVQYKICNSMVNLKRICNGVRCDAYKLALKSFPAKHKVAVPVGVRDVLGSAVREFDAHFYTQIKTQDARYNITHIIDTEFSNKLYHQYFVRDSNCKKHVSHTHTHPNTIVNPESQVAQSLCSCLQLTCRSRSGLHPRRPT